MSAEVPTSYVHHIPANARITHQEITGSRGCCSNGRVIKTTTRPNRGVWVGKVQVTGLNLPNGFTMPTVDIAADKTEARIKLTVAANVPPGDYSLAVRGVQPLSLYAQAQ